MVVSKARKPPKSTVKGTSVVAKTKGGVKVSASKAKKIQEEEDDEEEEEEEEEELATVGSKRKAPAPGTPKPSKKKKVKAAQEDDEEKEDFTFAKHLHLPETWGAHPNMGVQEVVVPAGSDEFKMIQKMMTDTIAGYHKNNTGNHPVRFTTLEVSRIIRVQNPILWGRYYHRKEAMEQEYGGKVGSVGPVLTGTTTDANANEFFLFHGLNENAIPGITRFGFDPRYCSLKGMFGAGIYFADNSSKANQYCHGGSCTASGFLTGRAQCRCKKSEEASMMLCRVALGDPFIEVNYRGNNAGQYWHGRRCEVERTGRGAKGVYNSVIGESQVNGGNTLLLREYIIYDSAQVYPEYVVYYKRK